MRWYWKQAKGQRKWSMLVCEEVDLELDWHAEGLLGHTFRINVFGRECKIEQKVKRAEMKSTKSVNQIQGELWSWDRPSEMPFDKSRGSGLFIPSSISHWMRTALGRRDTVGQGGLALLRQFLEGNENWELLVKIIPNGWENKFLIPAEGSEWHILECQSWIVMTETLWHTILKIFSLCTFRGRSVPTLALRVSLYLLMILVY